MGISVMVWDKFSIFLKNLLSLPKLRRVPPMLPWLLTISDASKHISWPQWVRRESSCWLIPMTWKHGLQTTEGSSLNKLLRGVRDSLSYQSLCPQLSVAMSQFWLFRGIGGHRTFQEAQYFILLPLFCKYFNIRLSKALHMFTLELFEGKFLVF